MELLSGFADVEDVGLALLEHLAPTRLSTPETLTFPLIVVRRVGGLDNRITDYARLQVDTFGASYREAVSLAESVRQAVLAAPASEVLGVSIDDADTEAAPQFLAYDDKGTQRYVAAYRLALRRPR